MATESDFDLLKRARAWLKDDSAGSDAYVGALVQSLIDLAQVGHDDRYRDRWPEGSLQRENGDLRRAARRLSTVNKGLQEDLVKLREERDLALGAMQAQDENHRRQLASLGLEERFPSLTHLADDMGEELLAAEARLKAYEEQPVEKNVEEAYNHVLALAEQLPGSLAYEVSSILKGYYQYARYQDHKIETLRQVEQGALNAIEYSTAKLRESEAQLAECSERFDNLVKEMALTQAEYDNLEKSYNAAKDVMLSATKRALDLEQRLEAAKQLYEYWHGRYFALHEALQEINRLCDGKVPILNKGLVEDIVKAALQEKQDG